MVKADACTLMARSMTANGYMVDAKALEFSLIVTEQSRKEDGTTTSSSLTSQSS